jgi:hypothetical protein
MHIRDVVRVKCGHEHTAASMTVCLVRSWCQAFNRQGRCAAEAISGVRTGGSVSGSSQAGGKL